jgi:PHP family Zn ribbon phosphoesterase
MMREFSADLHLHTCLSPCADPEMIPRMIVRQAKQVGLDIIAICDHNSMDNVDAVTRAGESEGLCVIPGMEITTREEVHILGLFRTEASLREMQRIVYDSLPGENDEEAFGPQTIVDEYDRVIGSNTKLLIGATTLAVEEVVQAVHRLQGLAIASHVDREGFSIIGQLGFIPPALGLDALEVSRPQAAEAWKDYPVITCSDAHFLSDIGRATTTFTLEEATIDEIELALLDKDGRKVTVH